MDPINKIFSSAINNCDQYAESLEIIRKNSLGKIWLIGGTVYRTIVSQLYGTQKPETDLDFIVEKPVEKFDLPFGWYVRENRFGNAKFINGAKQIDYVPLKTIFSICQRNIEPSIENYLSGVPINVQAMAYDVDTEKIIGDVGIEALLQGVVAVNNLYFAEYAANKKGKPVNAMIQEKADSLGFKPIFPN